MKKIVLLLTIFFTGALIFTPTSAKAVDIGGGDEGLLSNAAEEAGYKNEDEEVSRTAFAEQVGQIIEAAMSFLGIIFTVLMVYGGFLWMTSRGNEDQVDKAQRIITSAVIGLIIAVGAFSISDWAVKTLLGLLS